jgi:hypothetical protein
MLKEIFGSKMGGIIRGWRKLHNKQFHYLQFSLNIIRMILDEEDVMGWTCSMHSEKRNAYRVLLGKPEDRWEYPDVLGGFC